MTRPKIVILNSNYPSELNPYGDVFVHSRLKYYINNFDVVVLGYRPTDASQSYIYQGIEVYNYNSKDEYIKAINEQNPSVIGIHFVGGWLYDALLKHTNIPVVIWIHGEEALGWYRRLYNYNTPSSLLKLGVFMLKNMYQLMQVRKIIKHANSGANIRFIFVSEWMKRITEKDTFTTISNYEVIPNPIDSELFAYSPKSKELSKEILLIRSFQTNKYANDIAVDAIMLLSKRPDFDKYHFNLYGKGKYFKTLTSKLEGFKNISLHNYYIANDEIPSVHKKHGIFLCPTRQDAQGVSMCEAMSSGLVVVTSDNTAIPEFVQNLSNGILTNNANDIADAIEKLASDENLFTRLSQTAGQSIRAKSSHKVVIEKEFEVLHKALT